MIVRMTDEAMENLVSDWEESLRVSYFEKAEDTGLSETSTEEDSTEVPDAPVEGPLHLEWREKAETFKREFPGRGPEFDSLMAITIGEEPAYDL